MIKAAIAFSDLSSEVQLQDGRLHFGDSSISPYRHRALETVVVRTRGHWFATFRERAANGPSSPPSRLVSIDVESFHQAYREALLWPLDYLIVEVAQEGCRIKLRAGILGTAPVYCRTTGEEMAVSYDLADFLKTPCLLDTGIISRRLRLHMDYSARQIISGVVMLTERSVLFARPGEAGFQYPPSFETQGSPDESSPDHDALSLQRHLTKAVLARPIVTGAAAVELSGGMDSSAVACALGGRVNSVTSLGIRLENDESQASRRAAVVQAFGLHDLTVDMGDFPPSLDLRPDAARIEYPLADFYLEAFEHLWDSARSLGHDMLFTGVGGDQLFPLRTDEPRPPNPQGEAIASLAQRRADGLLTPKARAASRTLSSLDAPSGPLQTSVLTSNVCQSPHLLKRGLWPVSPLADPHLVTYCRQLPLNCRRDRETMRRYLQEQLSEDIFPIGYKKETFAPVLPPLIATYAQQIRTQLRECALADMGLVDQDAALTLLDDLVRTRARALTAPLASFLWMERFVRQFS